MSKLFMEEFAKLPPLSAGPDIKAQKSDKQDQILDFLKSVQLEYKAKPMPKKYNNWPSGIWDNGMIRVDNIPASVAHCWTYAIFALGLVQVEGLFVDGSNRYAFLNFDRCHYAKLFIDLFNGKKIPGTDLIYKLSWAPFNYNSDEDEVRDDDAEEEKRDEDEDEEVDAQCEPFSAELCSKIREFHGKFCKLHRNLRDKTASWDRMTLGGVEMAYPFDDGRTTVLCLAMLDPGLERGSLEAIFGKYGECSVHLPSYPMGYGFVKFGKRESAEVALAELATLLRDEHVCSLGYGWCTDKKAKLRFLEQKRNPVEKHEIEMKLKRFEEQELLCLHGEEEIAAVTTKMSKRRLRDRNSASKSKRGWDGEEDATVTNKMSKRRSRARISASKAKRGRDEDATVTIKMNKERDREKDATVTTNMGKRRLRARNCASKAMFY